MEGTAKLIGRDALTRAFSESIIQVSGAELERLCDNCSGEEVAQNIHRALRNFGQDLRQGTSFEYGDWESVLYLLWYQPRRVQSVYQLLKAWPAALNGLSDRDECPVVVDFACGAGAMAFGAALALADVVLNLAPVPRKPLPVINVWSMDSSPAMLRLGRKLWDCFARMTDNDKYVNSLHALSSACKTIKVRWLSIESHNVSDPFTGKSGQLGRPCFLSLSHGVYEDNRQAIHESMNSLVNVVQPNFVLATCHDDPKSRSRTNSVLPVDEYQSRYEAQEFGRIQQQIDGELGGLTNYRQEIFERLVKPHLPTMTNDDAKFVESFLTSRPVEWFRDDVAFLCYSKR